MPRYAGLRAPYVQLDPQPAGSVPPGTLFADSTNNNQATIKPVDNSTPAPIQGQPSPANYFIKGVISGGAFGIGASLARVPGTGKAVKAEADANAADHFAFAMEAATGVDQLVTVFLIGPSLTGFLTGLGFSPGDAVFLDKNAGQLTKDVTAFTSLDGIVQVGIADCADGVASNAGNDLIICRPPLALI